MSKIERYDGDVQAFASEALTNERTVFGGTDQVDDLTSQITPEFLRGWGIVGANDFPSLQDFAAGMFTATQFIAYLHQMGTPEWNVNQKYPTAGAQCIHNGLSWTRLDSWVLGDEPGSSSGWSSSSNEDRGTNSFDVTGDGNDIILTSKSGYQSISTINDFDEFSFIVTSTNTSSTVTIDIDGLGDISVPSVNDDTQLIESALVTVRFVNGSFFVVNNENSLTGNPVSLIGIKLDTSFSHQGVAKLRFDGGELNRETHKILFAKAQKTGLVDQALKDADLKEYGGKWGDGDGSTTFTCPIYDGAFIRYADNGRGLDIGRELNTWQDDENKSHSHGFYTTIKNVVPGGTAEGFDSGGVEKTTASSGGVESRPKNYSVNAEFLV